jgi:hypothetical protein
MSQEKNSSPTYLFVFRNPADMPDPTPEQMQQIIQKWMTWIASMRTQGVYLGGDPLEDTPAKVLRGARGATMTDGPFAEAKEVVAGYMLIKTASFDEAVALSKGCPGFDHGGSVEIRQLMPVPM